MDNQDNNKKVFNLIISLLNSKNIEFKHIQHEPVKTSEEAAQVRGTRLEEGIKALIVKGKKTGKSYMFAFSAHLKLDTKAVKSIIGEEIEFEKPEKIKELYGLEIGGVPPFGALIGLETYYDEGIFKNEIATFNAGTKSDSIVMRTELLRQALGIINEVHMTL